VNAGANAGVLNIANVIVGPGIQPQGAVVGPGVAFTPSFNGVTVNVVKAIYYRIGERVRMDVEVTATADASGIVQFNPSSVPGISLDTSRLGSRATLGAGRMNDGSLAYPLVAYIDGTVVQFTTDDGDGPISTTLPIASGGFDNTDRLSFSIEFPVSEWAGSGTTNLAQNGEDFLYTSGTWDADSSTTGYGPAGIAMGGSLSANRTKTITLQRTFQNGDALILEIASTATGAFLDIARTDRNYQYDGGVETGARINFSTVGSTTASVRFFQYAQQPNINWTSSIYWRVRHIYGGQAVGFGNATATSSGLVSTGTQTIAGVKTFNDGIKLDDDANVTTLNYYEKTTHNTTFLGNSSGNSSGTKTIKVSKIGGTVNLTIPATTATTTVGDTKLVSQTALATRFRPTTDLWIPCGINIGGNAQNTPGACRIMTTGIIEIYKDFAQTGAYSAATCGLYGEFSVSYEI
jgi:hypothetical protein